VPTSICSGLHIPLSLRIYGGERKSVIQALSGTDLKDVNDRKILVRQDFVRRVDDRYGKVDVVKI
jgi:hypothetical protein